MVAGPYLCPLYMGGMKPKKPRKHYKKRRSVEPQDGAPEQWILAKINLFLTISGQAKAFFGQAACADPKLVYELNAGRKLRAKTARRIQSYLDRQCKIIEHTLFLLGDKRG